MTVVEIPGSKSITARALFLAAAAQGCSTLVRPLASDDTETFVEGLRGESITVPGPGPGALQGGLRVRRHSCPHGRRRRQERRSDDRDRGRRLRGVTLNMRDISDTMPTLAAIAPFADGPPRIVDVANTRVKECDRLDACATNLRAMGIQIEGVDIEHGCHVRRRDFAEGGVQVSEFGNDFRELAVCTISSRDLHGFGL